MTWDFDGPEIDQPIWNPDFENSKNKVEFTEWKLFDQILKNFLGNTKTRNYEELIKNLMIVFENLGCRAFIKIHCLFSDVDWFKTFSN